MRSQADEWVDAMSDDDGPTGEHDSVASDDELLPFVEGASAAPTAKERHEFEQQLPSMRAAAEKYARLSVHDRDSAMDIAQEVVIAIHEMWVANPRTLDSSRSFDGWIIKVTRRLSLNWLRDERTRRRNEFSYGKEREGQRKAWMNPVFAAEGQDLNRIVYETLEQMHERQRSTYLRVREDGAKYSVVADERGVSETTVKRNVSEAAHRLRTAARDFNEGGFSPVTPPPGTNRRPVDPTLDSEDNQ